MYRYYEDVAAIKLVVEFHTLDSPRIALGEILVVPHDRDLHRLVHGFQMREKIRFEYRELTNKLDIYVPDKWQQHSWAMPVLRTLADIMIRALQSAGIEPKRTYV